MSLVFSQFDSFAFKVLLLYLFILFVGVLLSWTDAAGRWQVWWSYQISPGSREVYVCLEICFISELHGEYTLSKPSDRSTVHTTTTGRRGGSTHYKVFQEESQQVCLVSELCHETMYETLICREKKRIWVRESGYAGSKDCLFFRELPETTRYVAWYWLNIAGAKPTLIWLQLWGFCQ